MKNVKYEVKGEKLIITVDLKERHGLSSTGNTVTIASTQGNQSTGYGDTKFSVNVYTKENLQAEQIKAQKAKAALEAGA